MNTTSKFAFTCWYMHRERITKALLFDISDGYATLLLESGQFITDHIEHVTLDGTANIFKQCEWTDGEDDTNDQPINVLNTCDNCNYAREVTLLGGGRITVCDGQSGEMVQVNADDTCDDCEPLVTEYAREGDWRCLDQS